MRTATGRFHSMENPPEFPERSEPQEPEELTDEELEYVVGGVDAAAGLALYQALFANELE